MHHQVAEEERHNDPMDLIWGSSQHRLLVVASVAEVEEQVER